MLACTVQAALLLEGTLIPMAGRVWRTKDLPALERSALFAFGESVRGFVVFVREVVPPDATLVIPREDQHFLYGHEGMMEFFFFPRQIINCPTSEPLEVEACIRSLRGSTTYLLQVEGFPPREAAETSKDYVEFEGPLGVYVPKEASP